MFEVKLLGDKARRSTTRETPSVEAYTLVLHGRHLLARRGPALFEAIEQLDRAIELAPDYAPAYAALADAYAYLGSGLLMTPGTAFRRSREAAERALALDGERSDAQAALALIALLHDWDRPRAVTHAQRSIDIDPNYSYAHARLGLGLTTMGRFDEGVRAAERARTLDPLSPSVLFNLAICYHYADRYNDCLVVAQRAVELSPLMPDAHRMVMNGLFWSGRHHEAVEYGCRHIDVIQRNVFFASQLAGYLAAAGRVPEARELLRELYRRSVTEPIPWLWVAMAHLMLDEVDDTFVALRRALDARDFWMYTIVLDRVWAPLREDPRFVAVLKETGLDRGPAMEDRP